MEALRDLELEVLPEGGEDYDNSLFQYTRYTSI
jgi:hypothetical protein